MIVAVNVILLVPDIEIICQVVNLYNEKLALEKSWLLNVYARCLVVGAKFTMFFGTPPLNYFNFTLTIYVYERYI